MTFFSDQISWKKLYKKITYSFKQTNKVIVINFAYFSLENSASFSADEVIYWHNFDVIQNKYFAQI